MTCDRLAFPSFAPYNHTFMSIHHFKMESTNALDEEYQSLSIEVTARDKPVAMESTIVSQYDNHEYSVGWICPLSVEMEAARYILDKEHGRPKSQHGQDQNVYRLGEICGHKVVLVTLPEMGPTATTRVASNIRLTFERLRFGLLVGIGGGIPGSVDIRLGDVVVGIPTEAHSGVIQFDRGKAEKDGFRRTGSLNSPPQVLLSAVAALRSGSSAGQLLDLAEAKLQTMQGIDAAKRKQFLHQGAEHDVLFQQDYEHSDSTQPCTACDKCRAAERSSRENNNPVVHYGLIASGNQVIKDAKTRERLRTDLNAICVEMEACGAMQEFPCLVIRGICDYSDSHKNKIWQPYAALMAATFARELLKITAVTAPTSSPQNKPEGKWYVPFGRNPRFLGRGPLVNKLKSKLCAPNAQNCRKAAVSGLGGIGKSQIALELAYTVKEKHPEWSVFWVYAATADSFEQSYLEIGRKLLLPHLDGKQENIKALVQRALGQEDSGRWLLIVDNADDFDLWLGKTVDSSGKPTKLAQYIPECNNGSIFYTTRNLKIATQLVGKEVERVDKLEEGVAMEILRGALCIPEGLDEAKQREAAVKLLHQLDYVPLAMVQAASFINQNGCTVSEYLELFDESEENVIEVLSEDFEDEGRYTTDPDSYTNAIATTWLVSFRHIQKQDPLAVEYLSLMACLEPDRIPDSLLKFKPPPPKLKVTSAIGTLLAYSFIAELPPSDQDTLYNFKFYSLHRLVSMVTRSWLRRQEESLDRWGGVVIKRLGGTFPAYTNKISPREYWELGSLYFPHALRALNRDSSDQNKDKLMLLLEVGIWLSVASDRNREASSFLLRAWSGWRVLFGDKHHRTIYCRYWLGSVYRLFQQLDNAEKIQKENLQALEELLELPDAPDTGYLEDTIVRVRDELAYIYRGKGHNDKAESIQKEIFESRKSSRGDEHPATIGALADLLDTMQAQGRYAEAEPLAERLIDTSIRVLGKDHQASIYSLSILSQIYSTTGRFHEARKLANEILDVEIAAKGDESPRVCTAKFQLANIAYMEGRIEEALSILLPAIDVRKKLLGGEETETIRAMETVGDCLDLTGRLEEAEVWRRRTLYSARKFYGEEHPVFIRVMGGLGRTLSNMGRLEESEQVLQQSVVLSKKVQGYEHPGTLSIMCELSDTLSGLERYEELEQLLWEIIPFQKRVKGEEHVDTLTSMYNVAWIWWKQRRHFEKSRDLLRQVFETRRRALGDTHADTLETEELLAEVRAELEAQVTSDLPSDEGYDDLASNEDNSEQQIQNTTRRLRHQQERKRQRLR
ncbi:hypothetical protein BJ508DRAFT_361306 [Ascobolus immersus RN42]|uniref:Purine and uridine phosphorylase n=1 Tax=Ascobolus immersus RN42 TaxID=1160509 RepID=A0A3N4I8G6_ASCIM|nr:hypothetical protein BJ508DRAFT_361306 [Ascobolus immersus RN42]